MNRKKSHHKKGRPPPAGGAERKQDRLVTGTVLALASDFVGYSDLFPPKAKNRETGGIRGRFSDPFFR